jgi:hypothetical protein
VGRFLGASTVTLGVIMVQMDGSTRSDVHLGDQRTEIRLGHQATGHVQNALRWKIGPEAAGELDAGYRGFDNIGPGLVNQELAATLSHAFSDDDPLSGPRPPAGTPRRARSATTRSRTASSRGSSTAS